MIVLCHITLLMGWLLDCAATRDTGRGGASSVLPRQTGVRPAAAGVGDEMTGVEAEAGVPPATSLSPSSSASVWDTNQGNRADRRTWSAAKQRKAVKYSTIGRRNGEDASAVTPRSRRTALPMHAMRKTGG